MIKHITLGTNELFYFNYNGEELPLRPISSYELDDCFYKSLMFADSEISNLVIKLKLSLIKPKDKINVDNKKYAELKRYFDALDYWIVYHGMKDFQDLDFTKPVRGIPRGIEEIKKMQHVHEMASKILTYSYQTKEVIQEIVRDDDGKLIATVVFNLNVPLAELSKLTKLQRDFLILSKLDKSKPKKRTISKTGDTMDLRDILGGLVNGNTNR